MRRTLIGLALALCVVMLAPHPIRAVNGIVFVQSDDTEVTFDTTGTVTLSNVRKGGTLVVGINTTGAGTSVSSVADGTSTFTRRCGRTFLGGTGGEEIWIADDVAGGTHGVVVTISAANSIDIAVAEYAGTLHSGSFGTQATASGTSSSLSSGTITTSFGGEMLVAYMTHQDNETFTAGSGWTVREAFKTAIGPYSTLMEKHAGAAGGYTADGTVSTSQPWTTCVVSLRAGFVPATVNAPVRGGGR